MKQQNAGNFTSPSGKPSHRLPMALTTMALLGMGLGLLALTEDAGKTDAEWRRIIEAKLDAGVRPEEVVDLSGRYQIAIERNPEARDGRSAVSWITCVAHEGQPVSFKEVSWTDRAGKTVIADPLSGAERAGLRSVAERLCAKARKIHLSG